MTNSFLTALCLFLFMSSGFAQQVSFEAMNGPYGGYFSSMAVNSKGEIFIAEYEKNLYKSTDRGDTWMLNDMGGGTGMIHSVYINSQDDIFLYESDLGLHRSTDDGNTWEILDTYQYWGHTFGENALGELFLSDAQNDLLFKSTDNGATWQFVDSIPAHKIITMPDSVMYCASGTGLHKSTDNGSTWTKDPFFGNVTMSDIEKFQNKLYAGVRFGSSQRGLYVSDDDGASWQSIDSLSNELIFDMAMKSDGSMFVATRTGGIYYYDTNGNWHHRIGKVSTKNVERILLLESSASADTFFILTWESGVFRSADNGLTYKHMEFPFAKVNNIDFLGDTLITGSTEGVQFFDETSQKWVYSGLSRVFKIEIDNEGNVLAGTYDGLFRSTDGLQSWQLIPSMENTVENVIAFPGGEIIVMSNGELYYSTDNGQSWIERDMIFRSTGLTVTGDSTFYATMFYPQSDNNAALIRSDDFGASYEIITLGITIIDPYNLNNNYICTTENGTYAVGNIYANSYGTGLTLLSTNAGTSWERLDQSLRALYIEDNGLLIGSIAGDEAGLFISQDFGQYALIQREPAEMISIITDFEKSPDGQLYAATDGKGIYKLNITTGIDSEAQEIPTHYLLSQNYPNPFNPATTISFDLPETAEVHLSVHNILGEEVAVIMNESLSPGSYEYKFNASDLPSGVYLYRLSASTFTAVKKMLLMK